MKFTVEVKPFLAAVKRAGGVCERRNTISVLACVLIRAGDGLSIMASNLNMWATATCDASVATPGGVCIHADDLAKWLGAIPAGALVECEVRDHRAHMTAGRAAIDFATFPAEDFPIPTKMADGVEVPNAIPAILTCAPFCSNEEVKYYLKGVAINQGHAVATDGHILCVVDISADVTISAIIPTFGVMQMQKAKPDARLFLADTFWRVEDDGSTIAGKLIDGTFPDWKCIVPADHKDARKVDADALRGALGVVAAAARDGYTGGGVKLSAINGELTVSGRSSYADAKAMIACDGPDIIVNFNPKYLSIVLEVFEGQVIDVSQVDGGVVLFSAGGNVRGVLMPMRLAS